MADAPKLQWLHQVASIAPAIGFLITLLTTHNVRDATWVIVDLAVVFLAVSLIVERRISPLQAFSGGADAAGLAYDALERARAERYDVLLIDTAGRLQNKQGLMDELTKMVRVLRKIDPDAPHEVLLVLDATVGRNAVAQENVFGNMIGVTGIVMTKLDGTARGGVLVPVAQASDSPIKLVGVGEGIDDLQAFDARAFSRSLVGLEA